MQLPQLLTDLDDVPADLHEEAVFDAFVAWAADPAVRGVLIAILGLVLGSLSSSIAVVLVNYAVLFLLAPLVLRFPTRWLAATTVFWLAVSPVVSHLIRGGLGLQRVAEAPEELVVYGGIGRAARDWASFDAILETLKSLGDDETLLVQSGKPVAVLKTNEWAPRVLIANTGTIVLDHADDLRPRVLRSGGLVEPQRLGSLEPEHEDPVDVGLLHVEAAYPA